MCVTEFLNIQKIKEILFYVQRKYVNMIYSDQDTIAAIATAMSDAGIGIIRVSGPDAISIVDNC